MVNPVLLDGPNFVVVHFDGVSPNILDVLRIELRGGVDTVSDDPDAGEGGAQ